MNVCISFCLQIPLLLNNKLSYQLETSLRIDVLRNSQQVFNQKMSSACYLLIILTYLITVCYKNITNITR